MNRVFGAFLVVLLCSVAGSAQNLTPPKLDQPSPSKAFLYPGQSPYFSGANCPVGLRAQRQGLGNMVIVDGPNRYAASPRVRLMFDNWQASEIVAMTLTVHGYDAKARISPVGRDAEGSSELTKTVDLKLSVDGGKKASTDLILRPLATVSRVDLESVEYADGTRWSASAGKMCHVVPDLFMLVGSK